MDVLLGLVGIKPTVGLVSRFGIIPIAPSQDTPGPLARTVADAAVLLIVIAAGAGYPHPTVPMGEVAGLPVGLSVFGRAWSEPALIRLAYAYEQATKHRRPPAFPARVAIGSSTSARH